MFLANICADVSLSNAPASVYVSTQLAEGPNVADPLIPTKATPNLEVAPFSVALSVCSDQ